MKKRLIVLGLVLVMVVTMVTPALANSRGEIVSALRELRDQRIGARSQIDEAITWLNSAEGQAAIAGNERQILRHINAAIDAGLYNGEVIELPDLLENNNRMRTIVNNITAGARLAGVTVTIDMDRITANMTAAQLMRLFRVTLPSGQAAADDVIRQTGFSADYSVLFIVVTFISFMFISAVVVSVRIRPRLDGAK